MEKVTFNGVEFDAGTIEFGGVKIMLVKTGKGALGCGYINLAAAEKFGHALAVVSGVDSYEDMFNAEVKAVSSAAEKYGIAVGISGFAALEKMR